MRRSAQDVQYARDARNDAEAMKRENPHRIDGGAPEDVDGRLSVSANRIDFIGRALDAIAHAERDNGLPAGDDGVTFFMTAGGMLRELAHEVRTAQAIAVAQDWERELALGLDQPEQAAS
jgi:hypothetical protein